VAGSVYVPPAAGSQDYVWVEILDRNLISQGPIQFVNMTATLYYNAVGTWSMIVPYTDSLWNQMMSGDFLVNVNWRGLFTFGGKCEQPGYVDSIPGSSGGSGSQNGPFITLSGADYLALIANRIAYPTPSALWASQTAGGADAVTNIPLETAIKHYVNVNIGPGAIVQRRHTLLDIGTDLVRGGNVSYSVKFGTGVDLNLLDVIRAIIAQTNTSMGVRILRNAPAHRLTFDVYVPRDLSGKAWFSERLGNLTAVNFSLVDPTVTDALVQGAGTAFIGRSASARTQWNAAEDFLDNASETDVNILNTTAQVAILSGAVGPIISATMADTPFLTFGRDYYLGDIVTLEVRPGATYSDVITSVTLTADPAQTPIISVVPTIGNNANATATNQTAIGQLTARIRALEKKLSTK
jgi:hypothetical protein